MTVVTNATYSPAVFNVGDSLEQAKGVILTNEDDSPTDRRWEQETKHIVDMIGHAIPLNHRSTVLDYGCGIGRVAKELIARYGCTVVGVDISDDMRSLAQDYVGESRKFWTYSPENLPVKDFDAAVAVWVLQHCVDPAEDIWKIAKAMVPKAPLFLLNEQYRCVPTVEYGWVSDNHNVLDLLRVPFTRELDFTLDPRFVGERIAREAVARLYRKKE